jgi:hypothetical protein
MSAGGLFVLFALSIGVLTFIAWPVVRADSTPPDESTSPDVEIDSLAVLQREYDAALVTLRDLDFDFQTGKLAAADYRPQREALIARSADLLRQIDALKAKSVDSVIESAVAEERATHPRQVPQAARKRIEAALATKGKPAPSKASKRSRTIQ